jgi:uncharacterized damage-inducible protein DinB
MEKQTKENAMAMKDGLLPEFDHEMAGTRRTLERLPEDKFAWKPHEKSGSIIGLATHLANLPSWAAYTINQDSLDLSPGGVDFQPPPPPKTRKELLEMFEQNVASGRAAIAGASDAELLKSWSLLRNGKTLMTMPKIACLRGFVMNHTIHHRAQLGLYLRLNNIAVPALYGPSADEGAL